MDVAWKESTPNNVRTSVPPQWTLCHAFTVCTLAAALCQPVIKRRWSASIEVALVALVFEQLLTAVRVPPSPLPIGHPYPPAEPHHHGDHDVTQNFDCHWSEMLAVITCQSAERFTSPPHPASAPVPVCLDRCGALAAESGIRTDFRPDKFSSIAIF